MKVLLPVLAGIVAAGWTAGATAQETKPPPASAGIPDSLKDPTAQAAYALGLNLGLNLRRDNVPADPKIILRGLQDGLSGATPALTVDQMRAAVMQLQATAQAARQARQEEAARTNVAKGAAFLKANGARPGVVTLPDGLQYEIIKAGAGPIPKADDTVVCNYRGTLIDGTEFDSTQAHGSPATFNVGGVIKGWTEALQRMPVGSKWRIVVPAELAYGDKGAGQDIGPNAVLVFDVELLSIQPKT